MDFPFSENYLKHPFEQKFRRLNRGDLPTNFYKGEFVEQRWKHTRRIGSIKGLPNF